MINKARHDAHRTDVLNPAIEGSAGHATLKRSMRIVTVVLAGALVCGCQQIKAMTAEARVEVQELPPVKPDLPSVPTLPPPPHPVRYEDESYSVYGLRKKMRSVLDSDVSLTGYVVKIYEPPPCPRAKRRKKQCPPANAPHLWLGDVRDEQDRTKLVLLGGYAENHEAIADAIRLERRGRKQRIPKGSGLLPIPTDFGVGNKIRVKARFAYMSGAGFHSSQGVLEYGGHETLEKATRGR
ncbi:MAG: hypothetical protein MJD61_11410 [Proteobacteria bacterium]|nr:hypothetical protein [Pseudomonadota bacterium]